MTRPCLLLLWDLLRHLLEPAPLPVRDPAQVASQGACHSCTSHFQWHKLKMWEISAGQCSDYFVPNVMCGPRSIWLTHICACLCLLATTWIGFWYHLFDTFRSPSSQYVPDSPFDFGHALRMQDLLSTVIKYGGDRLLAVHPIQGVLQSRRPAHATIIWLQMQSQNVLLHCCTICLSLQERVCLSRTCVLSLICSLDFHDFNGLFGCLFARRPYLCLPVTCHSPKANWNEIVQWFTEGPTRISLNISTKGRRSVPLSSSNQAAEEARAEEMWMCERIDSVRTILIYSIYIYIGRTVTFFKFVSVWMDEWWKMNIYTKNLRIPCLETWDLGVHIYTWNHRVI